MALPKQIREQQKHLQEIEDNIRKELEEKNGPDTTQEEIDGLLNEVTPQEAEEKPDDANQAPDNVTELRPEAEGGDPESAPKAPERTDWKQKYSVLQGKYDAEVPRLSQDLRDANNRIKGLEEKLSDLAAKPAEPQQPEQPLFSKEEIADYGEDLIDVMGRKARAEAESMFNPVIDGLNKKIQELESQLTQTGQRVHKQEQNEVFAVLDREVKDWRELNKDAAFNDWLDNQDPFSGLNRRELMLNAFNANDALRVKKFFTSFVEENATLASATAAGQTDNAPQQQATLELNDYVAPGTPKGSGQAGAPQEKRTWSSKEVGKFYSDVQKGHYKSRPEDKARIEADIVAATREGRIVG